MWFVHIKLSLLIVYSISLYIYIISTTSGMLTKILSYLSVKKSPDSPILCVLQILKIFQILSLWLCYLRQNKRKIEVASILFFLQQKSVPYWSLSQCEGGLLIRDMLFLEISANHMNGTSAIVEGLNYIDVCLVVLFILRIFW